MIDIIKIFDMQTKIINSTSLNKITLINEMIGFLFMIKGAFSKLLLKFNGICLMIGNNS